MKHPVFHNVKDKAEINSKGLNNSPRCFQSSSTNVSIQRIQRANSWTSPIIPALAEVSLKPIVYMISLHFRTVTAFSILITFCEQTIRTFGQPWNYGAASK